MATVLIEIQVDDSGTVQALQRTEQGLQKIGQRGNVVMTGLTQQHRQAQQAAQLLARVTGAEVPRALENVIARSRVLGPALAAAFNASIALFFAAAVVQLIPRIVEWARNITGAAERHRELAQAIEQVHRAQLLAFETVEAGRLLLAQTNLRIRQLTDELATLEAIKNVRDLTLSGVIATTSNIVRQREINKESLELDKLRLELQQRLGQVLLANAEKQEQARVKAREEAAAAFAEQQDFLFRQTAAELKSFEERRKNRQDFLNDIAALEEKLADKAIEQEERLANEIRAIDDQIRDIRLQNEMERLESQGRTLEAIQLKESVHLDRLKELWEQGAINYEEFEKRRELVTVTAEAEIARAGRERFERVAQDIEQFFDRVFLTARSFGDVFRQLWTQILGFFVKQVARMVAVWITGQRQMAGASAGGGGGGGILGSIFGGIFGGGSGMPGPGGTAPTFPGISVGQFLGGGFVPGFAMGPGVSAGQGFLPAGGGLLVGARTGAQPGGSVPTNLLGRLFSHGGDFGPILGLGGLLLAGAGLKRGGVLGSLMTIGGGAMVGFAIGGPMGAAIGAVVGGIASLFRALFGQKKGDKARIEIMEPVQKQIKEIRQRYDFREIDRLSAVTALEDIRMQAVEGLRRIGGRQQRANIPAINRWVDEAIAHINATEAARQLALGRIAGLPPQEFAGGGFIPGGFGRAVSITAHAGEAILNPMQQRIVGPQRIRAAFAATRGDSPAAAGGGDSRIAPTFQSGGMVGAVREPPIVMNFYGTLIDEQGVRRAVRAMWPEIQMQIRRRARAQGLDDPV